MSLCLFAKLILPDPPLRRTSVFAASENLGAGRIHSARADKISGVPIEPWFCGAAYKNNMYALLGKPGYEDRKAELEARL